MPQCQNYYTQVCPPNKGEITFLVIKESSFIDTCAIITLLDPGVGKVGLQVIPYFVNISLCARNCTQDFAYISFFNLILTMNTIKEALLYPLVNIKNQGLEHIGWSDKNSRRHSCDHWSMHLAFTFHCFIKFH